MAMASRKQQVTHPFTIVRHTRGAGMSLDDRRTEQQAMSKNLVDLAEELRKGAMRIHSNSKAGTANGWALREFRRIKRLVDQQQSELAKQQGDLHGQVNALKASAPKSTTAKVTTKRAKKRKGKKRRTWESFASQRGWDEDTCTVQDDRVSGVHHRTKPGSHSDGKHRRR